MCNVTKHRNVRTGSKYDQIKYGRIGLRLRLAIQSSYISGAGMIDANNGTAPSYLAADLQRLSDMPSRRRLRSSLTHQLDVPQSQCITVGDWAFAVTGARLWNSLLPDIVASNTLSQFCRQLKTFLFKQSYPSVLLSWLKLLSVVLAVFYLDHVKNLKCNAM